VNADPITIVAPNFTEPSPLSIAVPGKNIVLPAKTLSGGTVALVQLSTLGLKKILTCQVNKSVTSATVTLMTMLEPGAFEVSTMLEGTIAKVVLSALTWFAVAKTATKTVATMKRHDILPILLYVFILSLSPLIRVATVRLLKIVETASTSTKPREKAPVHTSGRTQEEI
jgi:hypothetical protein